MKGNGKSPREVYQRRREYFQRRLNQETSRYKRLSNGRLLTFLLGAAGAPYLYFFYRNLLLSLGVLGLTFLAFFWLVVRHNQAAAQKKYYGALLEINEEALQRLAGQWRLFPYKGEEFYDREHQYAADLDLFGQGSLFQWLNQAHTYMGRMRLQEFLTAPPAGAEEIARRQEGVRELAEKLNWRQIFQAQARLIAEKSRDPRPLYQWVQSKYPLYRQKWLQGLIKILPFITCTLVLFYFFQIITYHGPVSLLILQLLFLQWQKKERLEALNSVFLYKESLGIYAQMLKLLETERFNSPYLKEQQQQTLGRGQRASLKIKELERLADWISSRDNAFYLVINILLLWDYQCMVALERWKHSYGLELKKWLEALGEMEALSSLAGLAFDHPQWAWPQVVEGEPHLQAKALGHPLIGEEERVCNDLRVQNPAPILLITGSNMSGKSTLLRTAGINLVLAFAGAPVCAASFRCSPMKIYTSMRVGDNLEHNISSFYAELLRIKNVVDGAKRGERVFFLLDEIFKGTNSRDRHLGAKHLIRQLAKEGALGLVSTHDLELGELEKESGGQIKNYHFREYYEDGKLSFDYKLRPGISPTSNALYLIKLAGIEVDDLKLT